MTVMATVATKRKFRAEDGAFVTTARGVELLPPAVQSLQDQVDRAYAQYHEQPTDLLKNVFLATLQDNDGVLFYRLLAEHLREMLPVIYDPTVGEAIKRYSHEYRRPRGVEDMRTASATVAVAVAERAAAA